MRRAVVSLLAVLCIVPLAAAQDVPQKTRVVAQVSDADPARWNLVLNNVRNVQEELGADKVVIEVVAYGPGIGILKFDAPTNGHVSEALKNCVQLIVCENTMRNQKLVHADMHPNVSYVPAGVVQIIRRQQEGWAYLRP